MKKLVNSFLIFHNEIKEECKINKVQFFNWYILKPTTLFLVVVVWITIL